MINDAPHTALEIADYIVERGIYHNKPVKLIPMMQYLYLLQYEVVRQTGGQFFFDDDIAAVIYGVKIESVHWKYALWVSNPITRCEVEQPGQFSNWERALIENTVDYWQSVPQWELVETVTKSKPFETAYQLGEGTIISPGLIRQAAFAEEIAVLPDTII